jgi:alpha-1,3-mannosyltransferase
MDEVAGYDKVNRKTSEFQNFETKDENLFYRSAPLHSLSYFFFLFTQGERDYMNLKGDTGPLVYPAGFVYLFSWLRSITREAILPAQYIFAGLYLSTQFIVMALYINSRTMPPWSLVLLCLSRRLHSIFVLRLFNDCWAMGVAYLATWALQKKKFPLSIFLFSLAVSVKMNVLLFAPGVLSVIIKVC